MKITLDIPDEIVEYVVRGIMDNFPEAGMTLACDDWNYAPMDFKFIDTEEDKAYTINKEELLATFPLIFSDKWPKGCTKPPTANLDNKETWNDWLGQADAFDFDAFAQLAVLGEVIYG